MGSIRERRYFDREFKAEAVRMITERGFRVSQVARDLGIHPNMLSRWKQEYLARRSHAIHRKRHMTPVEEELIRLRREVNDLQEERDILKKALAIIGKHGKRSSG
jgi:transposase